MARTKEDTHSVHITRSKARNWQRTPKPVYVGPEGYVAIATDVIRHVQPRKKITYKYGKVRLHARSYNGVLMVTVTCTPDMSNHFFKEYSFVYGPDGWTEANYYEPGLGKPVPQYPKPATTP